MYTAREVAAKIDHAVLKPSARDEDIIANAQMCRDRGVFSMCVRPSDVLLAARELADSPCCVSTVIGFPHGSNLPKTKAIEAEQAIEQGAREVDMVMNIGRFLSGRHDDVQHDIEAVVAVAHPRRALVKVILETGYLSPEQIADACRIARAADADFVKTSTGFGDCGATPEAVTIMLATVGAAMGIKASGGIRTWEAAVQYLEMGCARLGVGATATVLDGGQSQDTY